MSQHDLDTLISHFGSAELLETHSHRGDETAIVRAEALLVVMRFVKTSLGYDFLADVTAVDFLGTEPRFQVVYHVRSMASGARLRIKVPLAEPVNGTLPQVDSVVALWPAANWLEREVYDMYGIDFTGHPDQRRILLYEEFVGHPLRKDYPKEKRQPLIRRENLLPQQLERAE